MVGRCILHDFFDFPHQPNRKTRRVKTEPPPSKGTGENITVGSDTWDRTPQLGFFVATIGKKVKEFHVFFNCSMTWKIYYVNCVRVSYVLIRIFLLLFFCYPCFCQANHAHMC